MNKLFKYTKNIVACLLLASFITSSVNAAGVSATIATAQWTNVPGVIDGLSTKVTSFTLTSPANGAAVLKFYDTPTLTSNSTNWAAQVVTNAAYSYNTKYATNYVTLYTNYYGVTNTFTNLALVTLSNYVAAATNTLLPKLTLTGLTNTTVEITDVNFYFTSGLWVTNTGTGAGTLIMNVIQ